jgi:hypothetical protein
MAAHQAFITKDDARAIHFFIIDPDIIPYDTLSYIKVPYHTYPVCRTLEQDFHISRS